MVGCGTGMSLVWGAGGIAASRVCGGFAVVRHGGGGGGRGWSDNGREDGLEGGGAPFVSVAGGEEGG